MAVSRDTIATRVQNGVEFLDERLPMWRKAIDKELLDMGNGNTCILGQLFTQNPNNNPFVYRDEGYARGCELFDLSNKEEVNLGFDVPARLKNEDEDEYYAILTDEWNKVIRKRR